MPRKGLPHDFESWPTWAKKHLARVRLGHAVRSGKVHKPAECSRCGKAPKPEADGRSALHGHHHKGYDEAHWFDVIWLCRKCHSEEDRAERARRKAVGP